MLKEQDKEAYLEVVGIVRAALSDADKVLNKHQSIIFNAWAQDAQILTYSPNKRIKRHVVVLKDSHHIEIEAQFDKPEDVKKVLNTQDIYNKVMDVYFKGGSAGGISEIGIAAILQHPDVDAGTVFKSATPGDAIGDIYAIGNDNAPMWETINMCLESGLPELVSDPDTIFYHGYVVGRIADPDFIKYYEKRQRAKNK